MFSKFFYLIIFIFIFKSYAAFSATKSSPAERCKRAFTSVIQNHQVISSAKTLIRAVADPVKPSWINGKTPQKSSLMVGDLKEESMRMTVLEMQLKVWSSPSSETRMIGEGFSRRFEVMTPEGVFKKTNRLEIRYRELFVGSEQIGQRIGETELSQPKKTNEEETLKARGFSGSFTRGINEINETIAISEQLRKMTVDPYTVHFDYLGEKMREHIDFMERGAVHFGQTRRLALLREHAERAIRERTVTYEKWIWFNVMLAEIISDSNLLGGLMVKTLISYFPAVILMPTVKGTVGFITMNRGIDADVYPLGLSNKPITKYDTISGDPISFLTHDFDHTKRIVDSKRSYPNANIYKTMSLIRKKIGSFSPEKQRNLELSYWMVMHERPGYLPFKQPEHLKEEIIRNVSSLIYFYPAIFYTVGGPIRDRLVPFLYRAGYSEYFTRQISEKVGNDFLELYQSVQLELHGSF